MTIVQKLYQMVKKFLTGAFEMVNMKESSAAALPALMRLPEVEAVTRKRKGAIYLAMSQGAFPKPVRIGGRAVAWTGASIQAWIDSLEVA
jgi:prophage regulatory protein